MERFANKLLVVIAVLFSACHVESASFATYFIENKSSKDIVVVNTERPDKEPISIPDGTTYSETGGGERGQSKGPFYTALQIDVIFNNERIINYSVYDVEMFNNPLNLDNYRKVVIKDEDKLTVTEYYYTFVPEQYEMAEPYDPDAPEE